MNSLDQIKITDEVAQWYLRQGVTPERLQDAYNHNCVDRWAAQLNINRDDVTALADRWGIQRQSRPHGE